MPFPYMNAINRLEVTVMMKSLSRLSLLLFSVFLLSACLAPKTPQEVTKAFWGAVINDDAASAVEYSTLTDVKDFDGFSKVWKGFKPTWGKVIIDGEEASVVSSFASPENSDMDKREFTTYLVRQGDTWKVDYSRTKDAVNGGALGSLFGALSQLGSDLSKQFESSANDFRHEMERMSKELEAMSEELGKQSSESINQYADELRKNIQELEESINRALKDRNNKLTDEERQKLQEVAKDLDKDKENLSDPTPESVAESSINVGKAQQQLDAISNEYVNEYKKQWRELSKQLEEEMQRMMNELAPQKEDEGLRI